MNNTLYFLHGLFAAAMLLVSGCAPGAANGANPQLTAIDLFRTALGIPASPLLQVGETGMANSPSGRLKVMMYQDGDGRKYSVDAATGQVVEMDARILLPGHGTLTPLGLDELGLRDRALEYMRAVVPDFDTLAAGLAYEEGNKGDNYFYSWYGEMRAGEMNRPFAQIGLHKSGLMFAFYNTLLAEK